MPSVYSPPAPRGGVLENKKLPLWGRGGLGWVMLRHRRFLENIAPLASDAAMTQVIADVPELILAPLAFELSLELRKPHQHYLGLCMRPHRTDTELDTTFEAAWNAVMIQKQAGKRLIYCSFGTFHEGADAALLRFVTNLLEIVSSLPNVQLVCSVNKYVIETLRHRHLLTANTHFFSRVPQMRVLAMADVFITHAGFGSIKESIYYGVPMLAYPIDPKYDQNPNALKLEHHGLGLRGSFAYERPNDLKNKLLGLLEDDTFRERVRQFRDAANKHHTAHDIDTQLSTLLGRKPKIIPTLDLRKSI